MCGGEQCTQATGLLCYSTNGAGSCRKIAPGPFGYPRPATGRCTDAAGQQFIGRKELCDRAATRMGLDYTVATEENTMEYPPGCFWHGSFVTGGYDHAQVIPPSLKFNANARSTKHCDYGHSDYCLCASAPDCTNTNGSVANDNVCLCGTAFCDDVTGLYCNTSSNTCSKGDACTNVNGASPNEDCACGNGAASCNSLTGRYCYATVSQCGTAYSFSRLCAIRNGSSANTAACQCGTKECTQGTGLICYDKANSCRQNDPGPFGYAFSHGVCESMAEGYRTIIREADCEQARSSMGLGHLQFHKQNFRGRDDRQKMIANFPVGCNLCRNQGCRDGVVTFNGGNHQYGGYHGIVNEPICVVAEPCPHSDGAIENANQCTCGTSLCTTSTGLYCESSNNVCAAGSVCNISDGSAINGGACICGSSACTAGQFCYAEGNLCTSSPPNVCEARDGRAVNSAVNCYCGTKICTHDTGFICFSKIGGSCRKTAPGPFGHPRVVEGSCTDENRRKNIASTANCERAAVRLGLSNTMAKRISSELFPPGCFWSSTSTGSEVLQYNSNSQSTVACGVQGSECLCLAVTTCVHTDSSAANGGPCDCGTSVCTESTGLYCNASSNTCSGGEACANATGAYPNDKDCTCGNAPCNPFVGMYCYASNSQCSVAPAPDCPVNDGSAANAAACTCGLEQCTETTGLICFSTNGGGSCRKDMPGPFGYPRPRMGNCQDVEGRMLIREKKECQKAAARLGMSYTEPDADANSLVPPGCFWNSDGNGGGSLQYNSDMSSTKACGAQGYCICLALSNCSNTNGTVATETAMCMCGETMCTDEKPFCSGPGPALLGICSAIASCAITDGSAHNPSICQCGHELCTADTGLICYLKKGGGSCRKTHLGSFGYPIVKTGRCEDESGRRTIKTEKDCKHAGVAKGYPYDAVTAPTASGNLTYCYFKYITAPISEKEALKARKEQIRDSLGGRRALSSIAARKKEHYKQNTVMKNPIANTGSVTGTGMHVSFTIQVDGDEGYCTSENKCLCFAADDCTYTNGITANTNACFCEVSLCTNVTGLYCTSSIGLCASGPTCTIKNGTKPNSRPCLCGGGECTEDTGLYCISSIDYCGPACPSGYYRSKKTNGTCIGCSAGKWSNEEGLTSDEQCRGRCSAGRWSDETGLTSDNQCRGQCRPGTWSDETGLTSEGQCKLCAAGKFSSQRGLGFLEQQEDTTYPCNLCHEGQYSDEKGMRRCKQCPKGRYLADDDNVKWELLYMYHDSPKDCKICKINEYQDQTGGYDCKSCGEKIITDPGKDEKLHDEEKDCKVPASGKTCHSIQYKIVSEDICETCPPGSFCDGVTKKECELGFFCPGDGTAHQCPAGRSGVKSNASSEDDACENCGVGQFQPSSGKEDCTYSCASGEFDYQDDELPMGRPRRVHRKDACGTCPPGHYCRSGTKFQCPKGTYNPRAKSKSENDCMECDKDTYSNKLGAISNETCKSCGKNKKGIRLTTKGKGSRDVLDCGDNTECPLGTRFNEDSTTIENGDNMCVSCAAGKQANQEQTACALCPTGFFRADTTTPTCKECVEEGAICDTVPGSTSQQAVSSAVMALIDNIWDPRSNFSKDGISAMPGNANAEGSTKGVDNSGNEEPVINAAERPIHYTAFDDQNREDCARVRLSSNINQNLSRETKYLIYAVLASLAMAIIAGHRCLPMRWKRLDFVFAKANFIEDTRAMRSLDSRLGASFTFALLVVIVGIFVYVLNEPNLLEVNSLVPAPVPVGDSTTGYGGYGQLHLRARTFAPAGSSCDAIRELDFTRNGMTCNSSVISPDVGDGLVLCEIDADCATLNQFRGVQSITMELPDAFQTIAWKMRSSRWDPLGDETVSLSHILSASDTTDGGGKLLVGTSDQPTTLTFDTTRSLVNDTQHGVTGGCTSAGLRISYRDVKREESSEGTSTGFHFVQFKIIVDEAQFVKRLSLKLTFMSQLSVVASYVLSVIGIMKIIKTFLQLLIDKYFICTAKDISDLPEDVRMRTNVLDELNFGEGPQGGSAVVSAGAIAAGAGAEEDIEDMSLFVGGGRDPKGSFDLVNPMVRQEHGMQNKQKRQKGQQQQHRQRSGGSVTSVSLPSDWQSNEMFRGSASSDLQGMKLQMRHMKQEVEEGKQRRQEMKQQIRRQQKHIERQQDQIARLIAEVRSSHDSGNNLVGDITRTIKPTTGKMKIYTDQNGRQYSYDPVTKKSVWLDKKKDDYAARSKE